MESITPEIRELTESLNRLITEHIKFFPVTRGPLNIPDAANHDTTSEKGLDTTMEISGHFEAMLGSTRSMLANMGIMDQGLTKTVSIILQILSSIGSGGVGFGGFFGGLLGMIGGIIGGPLGAAAAGGIGTLLGGTSAPLRQQLNTSSSANSSNIVNQVIIKNPVTFTKAFDVEVRTRNLRGGIDL